MAIVSPATAPRSYPLGPLMFWVGFVSLLLIAGIIHRANYPEATATEKTVMVYGLLALWPMIIFETWLAVFIRNPAARPLWPTVKRAIWITLLPPMRMGMPCPFTGRIWIPTWGWCERGKPLEDRLDRAFHKPMLVFALLILPVLIFEFIRKEEVRTNHGLALALHISVAVIWVAFATEFAIKVSAVRRPFRYSRDRWLDLAIVILPMLEFALAMLATAGPLARLVRLTRIVAAPDQMARLGQMYRLRGLLTKGWRAVLVLRLVAKVVGNSPEKQLRQLDSQIAEMEALLTELKTQAEQLRSQVTTPSKPEA